MDLKSGDYTPPDSNNMLDVVLCVEAVFGTGVKKQKKSNLIHNVTLPLKGRGVGPTFFGVWVAHSLSTDPEHVGSRRWSCCPSSDEV